MNNFVIVYSPVHYFLSCNSVMYNSRRRKYQHWYLLRQLDGRYVFCCNPLGCNKDFESDEEFQISDVLNVFYFGRRHEKAILVSNNQCLMSDLTVIRDNVTFHIIKVVIWKQSFSVLPSCCNSTATWNFTKWASWRKYNCTVKVLQ